MMDFSWSDEVLGLAEQVIQFAQTELPSDVLANDRRCEFAIENWQRCADQGIMGWSVPKQYGGAGYDARTTVRLLEAFGYGCKDSGLAFAINSQIWSVQPAILKFGTEEQIQKYIAQLLSGRRGAFGITEADSGSDSFALKTSATRVEDGYVLNGVKKYVTLAPVADLAVVFANTNPDVGRWGVTAFIVERGAGGFSTTDTQPKMGLRSTPFGDMTFDNCFVHESQRLGPEGAGSSIFTTAMNSERGYIFASQLGAMQRQLEQTIEYTKQRKQFGNPIGKNQAVSHRIADMKLRHELARLILYKVAWLDDQGMPASMEASLAKLYISEMLVESSLDAIRNQGARGYLSENGIERDLRDSVGGLIYSGTSDIQRNIISRLLGL
ncbi:acyl-CoA dehydrogenase family protein [Stieleria varia]|uniref:Acyl-CoA dehydrogenase n=1 Tax=Stieleria varia TaxID=2528005 RepID=A0A5C6B126_9BACT|nr:acyl-CoA dehydrogenase family protein [Stieleria varia]TWU04996.1 Acyl-CoA dehydrogenase [Stieleria varia]